MSKPWYADGLRFTCTQCGDCCRTHGEYAWVFLTPEDTGRLAEKLGLSRAEMLHRYADRDEEGIGHTLKWEKDRCIFLGERGCEVYEARPEQCRTWPFWPENLKKKVWKEEVEPFCPGAGEGRLYTLGEIRRIRDAKAATGDPPPGPKARSRG